MGGCGGCGGGGVAPAGDLTHAITSGDLAEPPDQVAEADATHVVKVPTPDGVVDQFYGDYRSARIAQMLAPEGARIRRAP